MLALAGYPRFRLRLPRSGDRGLRQPLGEHHAEYSDERACRALRLVDGPPTSLKRTGAYRRVVARASCCCRPPGTDGGQDRLSEKQMFDKLGVPRYVPNATREALEVAAQADGPARRSRPAAWVTTARASQAQAGRSRCGRDRIGGQPLILEAFSLSSARFPASPCGKDGGMAFYNVENASRWHPAHCDATRQ